MSEILTYARSLTNVSWIMSQMGGRQGQWEEGGLDIDMEPIVMDAHRGTATCQDDHAVRRQKLSYASARAALRTATYAGVRRQGEGSGHGHRLEELAGRTGWRWVVGPPWAPDLRGRAAARCHCGSSLNLTTALAAAGGGGGGGGAAAAASAGGGSAASIAAALWLGWPPSSRPRASSSALPICRPAPAPPSASFSDTPAAGSSARRASTCR